MFFFGKILVKSDFFIYLCLHSKKYVPVLFFLTLRHCQIRITIMFKIKFKSMYNNVYCGSMQNYYLSTRGNLNCTDLTATLTNPPLIPSYEDRVAVISCNNLRLFGCRPYEKTFYFKLFCAYYCEVQQNFLNINLKIIVFIVVLTTQGM